MRSFLISAILVVSACGEPDPDVQCGLGGGCPVGYHCAGDAGCVSANMPDAGAGPDGQDASASEVDAAQVDAGLDACVPAPGGESCNGIDDDCDGLVDEGFAVGDACDGSDGDLCPEGVLVCNSSGTGTVCDDVSPTNVEACDGADNDCDRATDEDFALSAPCDGGDGDLCPEGTTICNAAGTWTECNDTSPTDLELCNATDDDCDGANNEGFVLGSACDGSDGDLCPEGTTVCSASGTGTICNDASGTTAEVCNGLDDDCDGTVDETFSFPMTTLYADADGDGYGSVVTMSACSSMSGWGAFAGDCHDGNALVHPGATYRTTSYTSLTGSTSWDYDCDGAAVQHWPFNTACDWSVWPCGAYAAGGWSATIPACGVTSTCGLDPLPWTG
jgi:hypothetical protein